MKNYILSAAIVAICATPVASIAADHNLYGQMRFSFNSVDDVNPVLGTNVDGLRGEDNVSLFGLKGSVGDDIKAFYHLQTGAPTDNGDGQSRAFDQRFFFAGLSGDFGKVAYGRMTNAYKFAGFKMDPFYNLSHIGAGGTSATGGATYGLSSATNGFTDNALQYTSPSLSGLKINVGAYIDDSNQDDHGTNIGAEWSGNGINVGFQFASNDTTVATVPGLVADGDALRLYGGFKASNWSAALSYETVDDSATTETNYLYLVGRFNAGSETELIGSIGTVDPDAGSTTAAAEGTGVSIGIFQTVAPKTQLYATFSQASLDATGSEDPSVFSIGAIHKFGFGS